MADEYMYMWSRIRRWIVARMFRILCQLSAWGILTVSLANFTMALEIDGTDTKRVIDAIERSRRAFSSFDVRLRVERKLLLHARRTSDTDRMQIEFYRPVPGAEEIEFFLYRQVMTQSGKRRIEELDPKTSTIISTRTFDGEIVKTVNMDQYRGLIQPPLIRYTKNGHDYFSFIRGPYFCTPYEELFRQRPETTVSTTEAGMVLVESPLGGDDLPDFSWKVWFDPDRGLLPVRCERYRYSKRLLFNTSVIERAQEVDDGVWIPTKVIFTEFNCFKEFGHFQEPISVTTTTVELSQSRFNSPVSNDLFDLAFPSGMRVIDEVRELTFITGGNGTEKNLDKLVADAKVVHSMQDNSGRGPSAGARSRQRTGLLIVNIVLGIAICAGIAWRCIKMRCGRG
ncbi:MAG: hypothetical protein ACQESR_29335 [Planctomycetota bacterium]